MNFLSRLWAWFHSWFTPANVAEAEHDVDAVVSVAAPIVTAVFPQAIPVVAIGTTVVKATEAGANLAVAAVNPGTGNVPALAQEAVKDTKAVLTAGKF